MNMKKTIAAIAACAMAVSAMATTVSAVDENATEAKSVHYDLTEKTKTKSADLSFVGKSLDTKTTAVAGLAVVVDTTAVDGLSDDLVLVAADKSTGSNYTFNFSASKDSANYDGTATKMNVVKDGAAAGTATIDTTKVAYVIDLSKALNGTAIMNALKSDNLDISVSISASKMVANGSKAWDPNNQQDLNDAIAAGKVKLQLLTTVKTATIGSTTGYAETITYNDTNVTGSTKAFELNTRGTVKEVEHKKPMKTSNNVSSTNVGTTEIINRLTKVSGTRDFGKVYENVGAVINDMIANYDDVVFTFNTAAQKVKGDEYSTDWDAVDYTKFPQQLYNLFGDETTGYTYSDSYAFNNLFNAALVANNGYTMNQSSIAPFVYDATSVSFSWSDMTGGNSFVSPASAVYSLQLATSSTWYWDSMDVKGYVLAAEDASTDAGANDDGEDLDDAGDDTADDTVADDDAADDDAADDDVADDDVADDDVADDDVAADDTAADDATATNPATGNAPIALAVIPVALAAAAVVAKKRG